MFVCLLGSSEGARLDSSL